eukprot:CAMPEP_0178662122 /NCGR_PEP_ID=MMETSP0698-20121128/28076_1 /TAXON_ID=265572 /ORGANISM="Extubocellulus spinifer, Strain CCMP396" /LENGTH=39 /DNA_ID= /DNA_START= /DNA_END= /DNA_ORIENTATION=
MPPDPARAARSGRKHVAATPAASPLESPYFTSIVFFIVG